MTFYAGSTYGRAAHATGNQLKGIPPCDGSTTNLELMGLNSALASAAVPGPLPPCCTGVSLVPLAVTTSGLSYCFTGSGGPLFREEMGSVIPVDQDSMGGAVLQVQNCFLLSVLRCLPALATLPSTCALSDRCAVLAPLVVELKNQLVPVANEIARERGRSNADFSVGPADEELLLAWCLLFGPIVCVSGNMRGGGCIATHFSHADHPASVQFPLATVFHDDRVEQGVSVSHYQALVLRSFVYSAPSGPALPGTPPIHAPPTSTSVPTRQVNDTFGALILEIAKSALPLQVLAPQHTWVDAQTAAWVAALDTLSRRIGPALQGDDDANLG